MPRPLRLVPPDPAWLEVYAREAAALRSALGARIVDLQHVGSTAVPGLVSKPVIDIAMAVNSAETAHDCSAPLEALGYWFRGPHGDDPRRRYYVREVDGVRVRQLHLYILPAVAWNEVLAFRDALRADGELVVAYAKEKQRVAALVGWDNAWYSVEKGPFIRWPDVRPEPPTTASRPAAVTLSCENHRLVTFP
jgi:GrpB-like predicted nucleotidyltransferase (UPF0157 family)